MPQCQRGPAARYVLKKRRIARPVRGLRGVVPANAARFFTLLLIPSVLLLVLVSSGRSQSPDALSSEVRLLRQTLEERLNLVGRAEIAVGRVGIEERRLDILIGEEGQARRELAKAVAEQVKAEAAAQELQAESPDQSSLVYQSWQQAIHNAKLETVRASALVQEYRNWLEEIATSRRAADKKLEELNTALSALERALSPTSAVHQP